MSTRHRGWRRIAALGLRPARLWRALALPPPRRLATALLFALLLAGAPATPAEPVTDAQRAASEANAPAATPPSAPPLEQAERIAVLELERVGASAEEGAAVTERLRETLLATGRFSLVPRAQLQPALGGVAPQDCASTECAVKVAHALGVHRIVTGRIARLPPRAWQASVQLLDVDSAEALEVKTLYLEGDLAALLADGVPRLARALAGEAEDAPTLEGSATAQPPGAAPAPRRQAAPDGAVRVAILPAYLDGEQADEAARRLPALIARLGLAGEAPRRIVVSHSFYPVSGAAAISARAGLVERTWQGAGPRVRPDVAFVQRLGRDLGVDAALLYRVRAERGLGAVQVIVVDVQSGRSVLEEARAPAARLPDVLRDRTRRAVRIYLERFGDRSAVR